MYFRIKCIIFKKYRNEQIQLHQGDLFGSKPERS